ncbi:glutamic acid-rich protein-like [Iris pallida]|uniref:Glutamic acid-rich protein-like n=1 Tax=Iris pallida TaxID=29817 RepID=A0AAX6IA25_IRIPA|nr:glutamic acid-rich protein-like [Iris pallida]
MEVASRAERSGSADLERLLFSMVETIVVETALVAAKSLLGLFMVMDSLSSKTDILGKGPEGIPGMFVAVAGKNKAEPENKDDGDSEDDDDEDDEDDAGEDDEDDDDAGEEDSGDEGKDNGGDEDDDPEANGAGSEDGDDDDDDEDNDDDDEDDEDEEEDDEEDEDDIPQPPAKKRK